MITPYAFRPNQSDSATHPRTLEHRLPTPSQNESSVNEPHRDLRDNPLETGRTWHPDRDRRPILVTGMHRSGTTWLGQMLRASGRLIEAREPLNLHNRLTILRSRVPVWYLYITQENEGDYLQAYRDATAFRAHPMWDLRRMRLGLHREPVRILKRWGSFFVGRVQRRRLLIKDPFAVFSIPWFAQRLGCEIVVTVRHPAAVVSSLKDRNWQFQFGDLLQQPYLLEERVGAFRSEMEAALRSPKDVIGQGSLLWKMIYQLVSDDQKRGIGCHLVRHEDLARNPAEQFRDLYDRLQLPFTDGACRTVTQASSLVDWRPRLTAGEIERIKVLTSDVWPRYYSEEDWDN
jgi:hypothetical protein